MLLTYTYDITDNSLSQFLTNVLNSLIIPRHTKDNSNNSIMAKPDDVNSYIAITNVAYPPGSLKIDLIDFVDVCWFNAFCLMKC